MIEKAKRMRERGATYQAISEAVGVSRTTVFAWLNPDYAEMQRKHSREAKRRRQTKCPDCGTLVSYEYPGEPCGECKYEREFGERRRRIIAAWNRGDSLRVIGAREKLNPLVVNSYIQSWKRSGEEIIHHTLSHLDWRERYERLAEMWNAGVPTQVIADRLSSTPGSIRQMVYRARRKGFTLKSRITESAR